MNISSFVAFLFAGLFAFITIILVYLNKKNYNNIKLWYLVIILMIIALVSILYSAFGVYKDNNNIIVNSYFIFMLSILSAIIIMVFFKKS